jgi:hypothetical protein
MTTSVFIGSSKLSNRCLSNQTGTHQKRKEGSRQRRERAEHAFCVSLFFFEIRFLLAVKDKCAREGFWPGGQTNYE